MIGSLTGRRLRRRWAVVAGLVLAATLTTAGVAQPAPWRIVQAGDGSLYLLAGGQRFSLEPDTIGDDELASYADGGDLGSAVPSPANGLGLAATAGPTATLPASPSSPSSPSSTPSSATAAPASAAPASPATPAAVATAPVATPTPLATPAAVTLGSRANPVPLGTPAQLADGWQLTVTATQPDATQSLLARNPGRPPPAPGAQLFLASVRLVNSGPVAQAFHADVRLRATGLAPAPYIAFPDACGSLPDPLGTAPVGAGQSISGSVCWLIQTQDAAALVLFDAPPLLAADTGAVTRTYFSLHR